MGRRRSRSTGGGGTPVSRRGPGLTWRQRLGQFRLLLQVFGLLWQVAAPPMAGVGLLTLLQALVPSGNVLLLKGLINAVAHLAARAGGGLGAVAAWLGGLLALQAASAGVQILFPLLQTDLGNRVGLGLGERIAAKAQRVAAEEFERPGFYDALYRAQYGVQRGFVQLFSTALGAVGAGVTLLTLGGLLLAVSPWVPLVVLVSLLPNVTLTAALDERMWQLRNWSAPEFRRTWYFNDLFNDRAAAKELRLYHLADHLLRRWRAQDRMLRARILAAEDRLHLAETAGTAVATAGFGAAFWILLARTLAGRLSLGGFGAYLSALQGVSGAFQGLLGGLRAVGQSLLYIADVHAFLTAPEEPAPPPGAAAFPAEPQPLAAAGLSFAYPDGPEVLHDLQLQIRPGEKLAVVGENGAGKSTLIKLLLGLYRPSSGSVQVAGRDASVFDPASRRAMATAVFQSYLRYPLTARENVGLGRLSCLEDLPAIAAAADLADAGFLARLPQGWETLLHKQLRGGVELSGGQWQRVATARALLRSRAAPSGSAEADPPVAGGAWLLVMDEPTAALDPLAEAAVFARFQEMAGGRTAIMVSHRLGSARLADRILVLDRGRVAEVGSHDELMAQGGLYARMFAMQAEWYAAEAPGATGASQEPTGG